MDEREMEQLADAKDRVARGAAWLDAAYPTWESRIDHRLDIACGGKACVLG